MCLLSHVGLVTRTYEKFLSQLILNSFLQMFILFVVTFIGVSGDGNASKLDRVDCIPERREPAKDVCRERGCIWDEVYTKV